MAISETSPLTSQSHPVPDYDDQYYYEIEDEGFIPKSIRGNNFLKYSLISVLLFFVLCLVYFMVVFLPSIAPDGVKIPSISIVKHSKFYLHPLLPQKSSKKYRDPDNPIKTIPDFTSWPYLSEDTKLYKEYISKLSAASEIPAKRKILIGDIHGCLSKLKQLLARIDYDGGKEDQVIMLGDFIDKGPDSLGVLDFAIANKIDCVLGNHEMEILKRYIQFHALKPLKFKKHSYSNVTFFHPQENYDLDEMMRIAKRLTPEHINFLSQCSLIQDLGPVPHYTNKKQDKLFKYPSNGVAVHAGIVWNKNLEDQDPEAVTTMRNLLPPNWEVPTDDRHDKVGGEKSQAWTKIWNKKQEQIVADKLKKVTGDEFVLGTKVYYGHDAKRGTVIKEYSVGLDSGCVYGGQLTADIIWTEVVNEKITGEETIIYKNLLVKVNC